ncbi:MBL fold metallo-hydrolase [Vibrio sp. JC009]|uniref:MBL fold metallo-hydrolase n=1 Tax=Vibrio sp. JC009 TaxID=2912314 RepID=UPI0023AF0F6C|nr:MBL fold metallo-hydrolase [Vibrio sp. JC009]WED20838.1 MBL fold metallo-hydrolase [Vibrio sp. JC009]
MSTAIITNCTMDKGAEQDKGKFVNTEMRYSPSLANIWDIIKAQIELKREAAKPNSAIPVQELSRAELEASSEDAVYRLGHSTILMRLDGEFIMTDPVFSDRASPVQWAGPKRFHQAPISIDELPDIKVVIISHDHYDHLDKAAVKKLAPKVEKFITPLKVGDYLIKWGVEPSKVVQLDWWQETQVDEFKIAATPAQHFSGRSLFDRDETLWASWVIQSKASRLFFSGDGGYFNGFKEIGERYGPFDLTMIETGAYNELWADIHMMPEHSMQAHLDLKGKVMMPIHNGTFDLAMHEWYEPFERIADIAEADNVQLVAPVFGEAVSVHEPRRYYAWWRDVEEKFSSEKLVLEQ